MWFKKRAVAVMSDDMVHTITYLFLQLLFRISPHVCLFIINIIISDVGRLPNTPLLPPPL